MDSSIPSNSAQPFPWPLESFSITTKPFVLSSYIVWDIVLPRRRESLHHQKPVRVALDASLTNQSHLFLLNYQRVKISIEILTHPKHPLYHTLSICSHENPNSSQTPTLSHTVNLLKNAENYHQDGFDRFFKGKLQKE